MKNKICLSFLVLIFFKNNLQSMDLSNNNNNSNEGYYLTKSELDDMEQSKNNLENYYEKKLLRKNTLIDMQNQKMDDLKNLLNFKINESSYIEKSDFEKLLEIENRNPELKELIKEIKNNCILVEKSEFPDDKFKSSIDNIIVEYSQDIALNFYSSNNNNNGIFTRKNIQIKEKNENKFGIMFPVNISNDIEKLNNNKKSIDNNKAIDSIIIEESDEEDNKIKDLFFNSDKYCGAFCLECLNKINLYENICLDCLKKPKLFYDKNNLRKGSVDNIFENGIKNKKRDSSI